MMQHHSFEVFVIVVTALLATLGTVLTILANKISSTLSTLTASVQELNIKVAVVIATVENHQKLHELTQRRIDFITQKLKEGVNT
jgi:5-bromo-4-chloroindolyl phosphate hydrolysis protein